MSVYVHEFLFSSKLPQRQVAYELCHGSWYQSTRCTGRNRPLAHTQQTGTGTSAFHGLAPICWLFAGRWYDQMLQDRWNEILYGQGRISKTDEPTKIHSRTKKILSDRRTPPNLHLLGEMRRKTTFKITGDTGQIRK